MADSATSRTHRIEIEERNVAGTYATVSVREETETLYNWGWDKTREVLDPDGQAVTTIWDHYDETESSDFVNLRFWAPS